MSLPLNSAQLRFLRAMRISMAAKALGLAGLLVLLAYLGVLR